MCLYPKLILNPKYLGNKKNGHKPPVLQDERIKYVPIGCGKCSECKQKKQREWAVRLNEEIRASEKNKFITLTFTDQAYKELTEIAKERNKEATGYNLDNSVATIATRRFLERYRKKNKKSLKHWMITELGGNGTQNIHIHGIIFENISNEELKKYWTYGNTDTGKFVNERTINYITKYVTKTDEKHKNYNSIILTSSGIGRKYVERTDAKRNTYKTEGRTNETYKTRTGQERALPIYYRNKIYTEAERETLWIEKLNKQIRWVKGEKIDISTEEGQKEYEKLREYYRKKDKELGYQDDKKDWEQEKYEMAERELKQATRIARAKKKERKRYLTRNGQGLS